MSISEFQRQSASADELVLRLPEALEALLLMESWGTSVLGWEGWLRYPDGKLGHSARHHGTVSLPEPTTAAIHARLRDTMQPSQAEHLHNPEVPGCELLFCMTSQA